MSTLLGKLIKDSYGDLLQISNANYGLDATSRYIEDGEGTPSVLSLSTTKVGVGTDSPLQPLDVRGNFVQTHDTGAQVYTNFFNYGGDVGVTAQIRMWNEAGNSNLQISCDGASFFNGGNVGIGTDNPSSRLEIFGDNKSLKFTRDEGDRSAELLYDGSAFLIKAPASDRLSIADSSSNELLTVNPNSGNVGIGTTDPQGKLHVTGHMISDTHKSGLMYTVANSSAYQTNQTISVTLPTIAEGSTYHYTVTRHKGTGNRQISAGYISFNGQGGGGIHSLFNTGVAELVISGSTVSVTNNSEQAVLKMTLLRVA